MDIGDATLGGCQSAAAIGLIGGKRVELLPQTLQALLILGSRHLLSGHLGAEISAQFLQFSRAVARRR